MDNKRTPWYDNYRPFVLRPAPSGITIIVAPNTISKEDIQRIVDILMGKQGPPKS